MVDQHAPWVRGYRWFVFVLAAGYILRHFVIKADYTDPGGPFRYLTFLGLLLAFAAISRMLAISEHRSTRDWGTLVGVAGVVNVLVVFLYWRLWFQDPALVQSNGQGPWYDEYYLHLFGPILIWIDALFIYRGFRRIVPVIAWLATFVVGYVAWIELFVQRFNQSPIGSQTSGLPYPFLNNMDWDARLGFYMTTFVSVLVFALIYWGLAMLVRRMTRADV